MAKKYLSLEEAAHEAGVSVDQLKQLREQGEIRGFSDGGTWKFKSDDIEELKRTLQADSNPEVPLLTDEELEGSSILGMEDEDPVSEQPTVIRGGNSALDDDDEEDAFLVGETSDSDVQLISNDTPTEEGGFDAMVSMGDSDSDVRLVDAGMSEPGSDSDVKLVGGSDSDVQIVGGSDSDVRIMEDDSDSDVKFVDDAKTKTERDFPVMKDEEEEDSDSDVALVPPPKDSGVSLDMEDTDASVFDEDSGVSLGEGSSITLAADSGISLEDADKQDSDLKLNSEDSGIALEGFDDSGISLADDDDDDFIGLVDDSGIELSPADSGIALESIDSGIALDDDADDDRTVPMMKQKQPVRGDDDDTAMDVPALDDDSEFELGMEGSGSDHETANIIMFDDDEDVDDHGATVVKKTGPASEEYDLTGGDDFDLEESFDEFDEADDFGEEGAFEDDLDVAAEEDELDVFDEGADDFDDDFDTGSSHPDFVTSRSGVAAPVQQADWGTGPFVGLLLSTLLMVVCGMMMFDLVRSMWSWNDPSGFNSPLLGIVRDMIQ